MVRFILHVTIERLFSFLQDQAFGINVLYTCMKHIFQFFCFIKVYDRAI